MGSSEPMTTQQRPLRLAILEADTPVPGVLAKYGKYGSVFAHLFRQACAPDPLESQLTLSAHDVVNDLSSYPDPETLDAVLITGSKHSAFEDHEWILRLVAYTKRLLEQPAARPDGRPRKSTTCTATSSTSTPRAPSPLAHTDVCATQAMYIPQRMIALQGHPEFTEDIMREILEVRHKGGILPDSVFEDAMSRAPDAHDGVAIARAFLKFLRE
ncbi:hypothetical protein PG987_011800 [Apiospora arundinis]